tara:strand:- start:1213 stop:1857 length:645 start_codon:yes stop_codon:yes gene_type:complete
LIKKIKVAVLISGNGTNLQALIDACAAPNYPAEIVLVVSNKANAKGIKRAREAGIKTRILDHTNYSSREEFDTELSITLSNSQCKLVCLAGFMRILSESFVNTWPNRILNIHPSLLPSFPGTKTHGRALEAGVKVSGCTLHFVTAELDAGPIIGQAAVPVLENDTPKTLANRVLIEEHKLYALGLELVANKILQNKNVDLHREQDTASKSLLNF